MARPLKEGLEYFPLDVDIDQDDKVSVIEALFGLEGFGVVIKLLMKIYKEGYYYNWTKREQLIFSRRVNVNINTLESIVNECIREGLFNETIYNEHEVLTSKGIQKRYLEAVKRRKQVEFVQPYFLLDDIKSIVGANKIDVFLVNEDGERVNVNINTAKREVNDNISTQRKEKERKEKERKEKHIPAAVNAFDFYQQNFGVINSFMGQEIGEWIDDLSQELVVKALQISLERNKRNWAYAKGILLDWASKGYKTLEQVEAADIEFKNQKGGAAQNGTNKQNDAEFSRTWGKRIEQLKNAAPKF